jgi:hypothetical protein
MTTVNARVSGVTAPAGGLQVTSLEDAFAIGSGTPGQIGAGRPGQMPIRSQQAGLMRYAILGA